MKTKVFDCVEMKKRGAELVQRQIAGMDPQEELDFWRRQTAKMQKRQKEIREKLGLLNR